MADLENIGIKRFVKAQKNKRKKDGRDNNKSS